MYHGIKFWTYDVGGYSDLTHQVTPAHIMGYKYRPALLVNTVDSSL